MMIRREIDKTAISEFSRTAPDTGSQTFRPPADFSGFSGHFPGFPIMPAMLQVLLGVIVVEKLCRNGLHIKRVDKAKFMAQIKPGDTLTVNCRIRQPETATATATEIKAEVTIFTAEKKVTSMTLRLEAL